MLPLYSFFAFKADNNKQAHLEKVNRKRLNTAEKALKKEEVS